MAFGLILNAGGLPGSKSRTLGAHKIAHVLRQYYNADVRVIDFCENITLSEIVQIMDKLIDKDTKFFGISTQWFNNDMSVSRGIFSVSTKLQEQINKLAKTQVGEVASKNVAKHFSHPSDHMCGDLMVLETGLLKELCLYAKHLNPNIKTLAGGARGNTLEYEDYIDHIFTLFSETQIMDFFDKEVYQKNRFINHDTRAWNGSNGYKFTKDFVKFTDYDFITPGESIPIELARGCRFRCSYCNYPFIGDKNMTQYIIEHDSLEHYFRHNYDAYGTTKYIVTDDTFNDSTEKLEHYVQVAKKLPFRLHFWAYTRADVFAKNPEMAKLLLELGLHEGYFGIETFTHKTGKAIGKGMDPERIKQILRDIKKEWQNDAFTNVALIMGLPYEGYEELDQNLIPFLFEDNCPIDELNLHQLMISSKVISERFPHGEWSLLDREYEKWGYSFEYEVNPPNDLDQRLVDPFWHDVDNENGAYSWKKNDGSSITSFMDTREARDYVNEAWLAAGNTREDGVMPFISPMKYSTDNPHYQDWDKFRGMSKPDQIKYQMGVNRITTNNTLEIRKNYVEPLLASL